MEYILLGLSIVLLVLLIISLKRNTKLKQEIKTQCGELYNQELTNLTSFIDKLKLEVSSMQNETLRLQQLKQQEIASHQQEVHDALTLYQTSELERINLSIEQEYTSKRTEAENNFKEFITQLEANKLIGEMEYADLVLLLTELREKHNAALEVFKKAEEDAAARNFYRIILTDFDKDDIIELKSIEPKIHNREILAKLIWEVYYSKPYTELSKRVIGNEKVCGIYKITNIENNKSYIGKSTDIANRWKEHIKSSLGIGTIAKSNFHKVLRDEGIDAFTWEIIDVCTKDTYTAREHYWIDFFQTQSYGYNEKS